MSTPGVDIEELLRRHGVDALEREAEAAGLSPRARRLRCPFEGCAHKGPERERDAQLYDGGHPRIFCFACEAKGDLLDLLQASRGWSKVEAISFLGGQVVPARPPQLRVVHAAPEEDPEKLKPAEVQRLWAGMAAGDAAGEAYVEKRGLEEAVRLGLVRFAVEVHPDKRVSGLVRRGYRVAALLTDVVGNPRGIQVRLAREPRGDEPKILSVKGSSASRAFFGMPQLIEAEPVVCVAEGMADTLAVAVWVGGRAGVCVVGATGKGNLPKLAKELEAAAIPLEGKLFILFPQNDRPKNESRREFVRLGQLLVALGARIVLVNTHEEFKDVAAWRHAHPEGEWPPAEVRKAYQPEPGDDLPGAERPVLPEGLAVAIPAEVRTERFAQDFTTLCALLDDPMHREAIMGRGEITWCEMTWRVRHAGRELSEVDLSTIRLGLEAQGRSTDGKPLKFSEDEIAKALSVLARRKAVHPVRAWLQGLRWDGVERVESGLAAALGHEAHGFTGRLLVRWMVSAVARAMSPGCKVDTVLVLVGNQGDRKSTFFEILGGSWFTDTPVHVGDKDGKLVMRRAWLIEWAELESMRRAKDHEALKGFLSARVDLFRKPYGREVVEAPRHCVIVGTSNPRDYLNDSTGNRRFWTIEVPRRIDFDWVREHREQLWAEAASIYSGAQACARCRPQLPHSRCEDHRWWLTDEEDGWLAEHNKSHEAQHPWTDIIRDWLSAHPVFAEVTSAQLLVEVLDMEAGQATRAAETAIGNVMAALGWEKRRRRAPGGVRWVYVRPTAAELSRGPA